MSQTSPKILVVTRTYNRPEFLARARKSLEEQTYRDFTWVVVNDGGAGASVDAEVEKARQSGMESAVLHLDETFSKLLDGDDCLLPSYSDMVRPHLDLISMFNPIFFGEDHDKPCPVT